LEQKITQENQYVKAAKQDSCTSNPVMAEHGLLGSKVHAVEHGLKPFGRNPVIGRLLKFAQQLGRANTRIPISAASAVPSNSRPTSASAIHQ